MLATWCELNANDPGGISLGLGLVPGTFYSTDRVLTFRPIWRGFAIDTLFYAVICWLLFTAPFALRRRRRIRRGLCSHCKYPVGTSLICTECGKTVKPKPAEVAA